MVFAEGNLGALNPTEPKINSDVLTPDILGEQTTNLRASPLKEVAFPLTPLPETNNFILPGTTSE